MVLIGHLLLSGIIKTDVPPTPERCRSEIEKYAELLPVPMFVKSFRGKSSGQKVCHTLAVKIVRVELVSGRLILCFTILV